LRSNSFKEIVIRIWATAECQQGNEGQGESEKVLADGGSDWLMKVV
jgi:hypothetical protein